MDINELIVSDAALNVIDNGAWVGNLPGYEGCRIFVRGMQSEKAQKFIQARQAQLRSENDGEPLTPEQHVQVAREVLGEIFTDWDGFTDKGKPAKFDQKKIAALLKTRNGEKLAGLVYYGANKIDSNAESFVESATKNSLPA